MTLNTAVIGPGRSKQGTGPYITNRFHQNGANIIALISSSLDSAVTSAENLKNEFGIDCKAYANLEEALNKNTIDIVVISSPTQSHHQYVTTAIQAGCHIFCEKPLWWPESELTYESNIETIKDKTAEILKLCRQHNVILQLNTQWPFTLSAYYELYPQQSEKAERIHSFSMWLSPQSTDLSMIIDSAPHLLSMLYVIVGSGRIQNIKSNYKFNKTIKELQINFEYLHAIGDINVNLTLAPTDTMPKPAAYAINNNRVDRHVELRDYLISLRSSDKQIPIVDPLDCSVRNFISSIYSKSLSDDAAIIDGMVQLAQIYQAITSR